MRIEISSSQREEIDDKYKESARRLVSFLAEEDNVLLWGSGCRSIMGICYDEFAKRDRKILGYTTEKYVDEIELLPKATHVVCKDTFDLKKILFDEADLLVMLPGGTGTVSELFAYLEEIRSNDRDKALIVYDEFNHFNKVFDLINDMIERDFNSESIYDYFKVAHNMEEFKKNYNSLKLKM